MPEIARTDDQQWKRYLRDLAWSAADLTVKGSADRALISFQSI
jgi:hypothetical protein